MISFALEDVKKTMHHILKGSLFDHFEVRGIEIQSYTKFQISGIADKDYNETLEEEKDTLPDYITWAQIKSFVLEIIKSTPHSPKMIKIVFSIPQGQVAQYHHDASALFINFLFKDKAITISTGSAMKSFTLNREGDFAWDQYVMEFFKNAQIPILKEK